MVAESVTSISRGTNVEVCAIGVRSLLHRVFPSNVLRGEVVAESVTSISSGTNMDVCALGVRSLLHRVFLSNVLRGEVVAESVTSISSGTNMEVCALDLFFIESFPQMCFEGKWLQNRLRRYPGAPTWRVVHCPQRQY